MTTATDAERVPSVFVGLYSALLLEATAGCLVYLGWRLGELAFQSEGVL